MTAGILKKNIFRLNTKGIFGVPKQPFDGNKAKEIFEQLIFTKIYFPVNFLSSRSVNLRGNFSCSQFFQKNEGNI